MKRLHLFLVLVLFVFPVFAGAALAAERPVPAQSRSTVTKDAVTDLPGDVADLRKGDPSRALAHWWHWGVFSPTDEQISQNTLAYRTYRTSPYVTADYIKRTDELIDSFDKTGGGFDPSCACRRAPTR